LKKPKEALSSSGILIAFQLSLIFAHAAVGVSADSQTSPLKAEDAEMKAAISKTLVLVFALMVIVSLCRPAAVFSSEQVTLTGEVNDSYQVVSENGQTYEVADNEKGNELVLNHIGERVRVSGSVEEEDDVKILTVTSFEMLKGE
jgi:hypothetical protein